MNGRRGTIIDVPYHVWDYEVEDENGDTTFIDDNELVPVIVPATTPAAPPQPGREAVAAETDKRGLMANDTTQNGLLTALQIISDEQSYWAATTDNESKWDIWDGLRYAKSVMQQALAIDGWARVCQSTEEKLYLDSLYNHLQSTAPAPTPAASGVETREAFDLMERALNHDPAVWGKLGEKLRGEWDAEYALNLDEPDVQPAPAAPMPVGGGAVVKLSTTQRELLHALYDGDRIQHVPYSSKFKLVNSQRVFFRDTVMPLFDSKLINHYVGEDYGVITDKGITEYMALAQHR